MTFFEKCRGCCRFDFFMIDEDVYGVTCKKGQPMTAWADKSKTHEDEECKFYAAEEAAADND